MSKKYRRKVVDVIATQYTETQSHSAIEVSDVFQGYSILTDFGIVEINYGDWVIEINGKIKVLTDEYFKEHYEEIPEKVKKNQLKFVSDCV